MNDILTQSKPIDGSHVMGFLKLFVVSSAWVKSSTPISELLHSEIVVKGILIWFAH